MSNTVHLGLRISEGLSNAIEELASEYRTSKSEVARNLLTTGLEESDDEDIIPEHDLIAYKREEIKRQNRVQDWRGGFETRVKQEFTRRFKNGYRAEDLAAFADGYRQEAHLLWPDDCDRRKDALAYIDAMLEQASEAMEKSEHEPLNPETAFESFSGVEEAREEAEKEEKLEPIAQSAHRLLCQGMPEADIRRRLMRETPPGVDIIEVNKAIKAARGADR